MKNERIRNATRNLTFGILLQIYRVVVPFAMRTIMIYLMGVQYLGLHSLFSSILQVLNLAELGVGSAMVYSMYKPIAEADQQTICALMRLYRTYYSAIGMVIGVVGLLLTPYVPRLINGEFPSELNIYVLYWMNLGITCLSYWLFAYRGAVLTAHQRDDIASKITIVTETIKYSIQLLVLYLTRNYYLYLLVALAAQALTNVFTAIAAIRMYPQYSPKGQLPQQIIKDITRRIRDLFTAKVGGTVLNSADSIVISSFLGLTVLAIYQNYFFIMTSVINVFNVVFRSCTAGIGNSILTESESKNYQDFCKFTFLIFWLLGICCCCFLNLYQPFIELWVGRELMLPMQTVICLCLYFFVYEMLRMLNTYKSAAGLWHEDRFRPIVSAVANLTMNLLAVRWLGLYGIILSSVLALFLVELPWIIDNIFSTLFQRAYLWKYLRQLLYYTLVSGLACVLSYLVCSLIQGNLWLVLLTRAVVCVVLPNVVFLAMYHTRTEFSESVLLVDKMTKHRFHLEKLVSCINRKK